MGEVVDGGDMYSFRRGLFIPKHLIGILFELFHDFLMGKDDTINSLFHAEEDSHKFLRVRDIPVLCLTVIRRST